VKDLIAVTTYCRNVEDYSDSQVPRIVARITSVFGQSTGWVEFDTRTAWSRAGSPKPMAFVCYRHAKIVRVAFSPNGDESPRVYADTLIDLLAVLNECNDSITMSAPRPE
jgi:hypothetical protein